jgi:hypothetical protein
MLVHRIERFRGHGPLLQDPDDSRTSATDMPHTLYRFDTPEDIADWSPVDDVVMGGVSHSTMRHDSAGHAVFEGVVSLERNGGFASVRSRPRDLGVAGALACVLEVRGDGKRYKLNLRTDALYDGVNYQQPFDAPAGVWATVHLDLANFAATFRGRVVDAPPLDPARLTQVGFVIADRQAGPFRLEVSAISLD